MRRIFIISLLFLSLSSVFAEYSATLTKHLTIQGGFREALYIQVVPIASQSQSYIMGMPFSIEDSLVQFGYSRYGRQVAQWSLLANEDFRIQIDAPDLEWLKNDSYPNIDNCELPYILTFEYQIAYYPVNSSSPQYETRRFAVRSEGASGNAPASHAGMTLNTYDQATNGLNIFGNEAVDFGSFVGSVEGIIYFKFDENADISAAPGGDYNASVTIKVVGA